MRQQGRTADGAAIGRACHLLHERPLIFADTHAIDLLDRPMRALVRSPLLYRLLLRRGLRRYRRLLASTLCAMQYVDERLGDAVHEGFSRYVVLGAGLDSFALRRRDLCRRLQVVELDHPATQALKMRRIVQRFGAVPRHLTLVPIDFERQSLAEALEAAGLGRAPRTLFSWIASIPYVTPEAVDATFAAIADIASPGSELVFNCARPLDAAERAGMPERAALERATARRGEPLRGSDYAPEALAARLGELGFDCVELLDARAQAARFVPGARADAAPAELAVAPDSLLARFRRRADG